MALLTGQSEADCADTSSLKMAAYCKRCCSLAEPSLVC